MMTGGLIGWQQPAWLLLLAPVALCLGLLWHRQREALRWLESHTSPRRRGQWTRHSQGSLLRHFGLLLAAAVFLALAAAGPFSIGTVTAPFEDRSIVLLVDASLSMAAKDVPPQVVRRLQIEAGMTNPQDGGALGEPTTEPISRLAAAQEVARALLHAEPRARFALVTFSGAAVIHSPPTYDHLGLESLLRTLRLHVDVPTSGTRFSTAFEAAARLVASRDEPVDVVLLSDGELPEEDAVDEGLRLLELRGTPVHAIGVGGTEAVGLQAYRLDDMLWNQDENRVATSFETRRVDDELRRITERTQSTFVVPQEGDALEPLLGALSSDARGRGAEMEGERDLSGVPLFLFLLLFLHESLWLANLGRSRWIDGVRSSPETHEASGWPAGVASPGFEKIPGKGSGKGTGRGTLALALAPFLLLAECPEPFGTGFRAAGAMTLNEMGRDHAESEDWMPAQLAFRHAVALGWRSQISRTNLGTVQLDGAATEEQSSEEPTAQLRVGPRAAHETFEQVLAQHPRYRPAQHGDGIALYRWGSEELDVERCETQRTRVLWEQAQARFRTAGRFAFWFTGGRQVARLARANEAALNDHLGQLDAIDARCQTDPPPEPSPEDGTPPPPDSGSGNDGNEGGNGGGGGGDDEQDGEGEPEQAEDESQGSGDGGGSGEGDGELSNEEKDEVAAALERIRAESQQARGYHQLGRSQVNPDNARAGVGLVRKW